MSKWDQLPCGFPWREEEKSIYLLSVSPDNGGRDNRRRGSVIAKDAL